MFSYFPNTVYKVLNKEEGLYKGWVALQNWDAKKAQEEFRKAHDVLQNHIIYHPICHVMLAISYTPHPIKMTKEVYLGIMAPWASVRRNIRRKKEEENSRK